jgi:hypothetical protein
LIAFVMVQVSLATARQTERAGTADGDHIAGGGLHFKRFCHIKGALMSDRQIS